MDNIIKAGPADDANVISAETIGIMDNQEQNTLYQKICEKWIQCREPYWALEDSRQYTFRAMVVAYQLGISMVLEKVRFLIITYICGTLEQVNLHWHR